MKFFDLSEQQRIIKSELDSKISRVLSHGKFILGPEVYELEEKLAEYCGAKYCITCANGTDALQIALMALNVGPGDEIITPAFSYISAAETIVLLGAKPIYIDIEEESFNMNPKLLKKLITPKTKAIIPVSLFGLTADFDEINKIAKLNDITVIEDAAQSFGALYKNKKSCNLSEIGCTSFFPTKPLGCYGDGGAIFTSNYKLAKSMRQIARHGQENKYNHVRIGINSRLDTLQAAILLIKLKLLDNEIYLKEKLSNYYNNKLIEEKIQIPKIRSNFKSAWAQYTIRSKKRDLLQKKLNLKNIPTAIYYSLIINQQPALFEKITNLQVSENCSKEVLSLPMYPYISSNNAEILISEVIKALDEI